MYIVRSKWVSNDGCKLPVFEIYLKVLLNPSHPNPGRREKNKLKAFIKPFEAPQRSVKIKIQLNFYFNTTFRNARDWKG